jgi:hypothetical protein
MATVSKMGFMIVMGSTKAQGSKAKPAKSGQSRPEQPERETKQHKWWLAAGTSDASSRGPDILKLCI